MLVPEIIFESDELLVIDKPAGLIVHSDGRTVEPSMAEWVLKKYPALAEVGEPWISPQGEKILLPGIVHRLDRTTSGVMLLAKTQEMYLYLKQQFTERKIEKTYMVWVYGHPETSSGQVVAEIVRAEIFLAAAPALENPSVVAKRATTSESKKGWAARSTTIDDTRAAITKWKALKETTDAPTGEPASLLEIEPLTGRTHQIRVHISSIGHPVIADHLYAPDRAPLLNFQRPALHASTISLTLAGEQKSFSAPPPKDFHYASLLQNTRIRTGEDSGGYAGHL